MGWYCSCGYWWLGGGTAAVGAGSSCGSFDLHKGNESQNSTYATYASDLNVNYYSFLESCMSPYGGDAPGIHSSHYSVTVRFSLVTGTSGDLALTVTYRNGDKNSKWRTSDQIKKGSCFAINCVDSDCSALFATQGWSFCFNGVMKE